MTSLEQKHSHSNHSSFLTAKASERLRQFAQHAPALSQPGVVTPERLKTSYAEACGYRLLYGTERVDAQILEALQDLAVEMSALEKMKNMQAGEIVNFIEGYPSENRPALHTATRDFFNHPNQAPKAKEAAQLAKQEVHKLEVFMAKLEVEKRFDDLIVIGIGGSEQGPRASYVALSHLLLPGRRVSFISNVDPDDAASVLKSVNLKRTLVVSISKSGTTLETETNEELVKSYFKKAGVNPRDHFIAITMPGTPMDNREHYAEVFHMWDWIGGRYSTSSMVGGVILSFAFGFHVFWEMIRGAHEMDLVALEPDLKKNLPLLAALIGIWNRNFLDYPTLAIIPYSQALRDYPAHFQQVDMESNGKRINQQGETVDFQTGPVLWGSLGTNSQHSYFQLLHQGTATIPLFMIGFKESQWNQDLEVHGTTSQEKLLANLFAQSLALAIGSQADNPNKCFPGNRPSSILLGHQLTPYAVGALLAFYEHKVAFQGFIWGINSFDQEGVQLGKKLANGLIDSFAEQRLPSSVKKENPLGEAYLEHLNF